MHGDKSLTHSSAARQTCTESKEHRREEFRRALKRMSSALERDTVVLGAEELRPKTESALAKMAFYRQELVMGVSS